MNATIFVLEKFFFRPRKYKILYKSTMKILMISCSFVWVTWQSSMIRLRHQKK